MFFMAIRVQEIFLVIDLIFDPAIKTKILFFHEIKVFQ